MSSSDGRKAMDTTVIRRKKERRRRRRPLMWNARVFLLAVVVWWAFALSLTRPCLSYTAVAPFTITTLKNEVSFDYRRGFVFGRAGALLRQPPSIRSRMALEPAPLSYHDDDDDYDDWLFDDRKQRIAFYGILAFLETVFWYWGAPGIDPRSRWFNPSSDGKLIATLLDPSIVFAPPAGSGLGFSSLLLNSFLILPMVWSLLLLQEQKDDNDRGDDDDDINGIVARSNLTIGSSSGRGSTHTIAKVTRLCVCAGSFFVGGGILIPYMVFRPPMPHCRSISRPEKFPALLRLFEKPITYRNAQSIIYDDPSPPKGQILLVTLVSVILISFLLPFVTHQSNWIVEWNAFVNRAHSSQFTALALYDLTMISITVLDPMMDDAIRRGYVVGWKQINDDLLISDPKGNKRKNHASDCDYCRDDDHHHQQQQHQWRSKHRTDGIRRLAPYVAIPLIGPVAWICFRPRYDMVAHQRIK